jgi:phenylpropionate dioxygenase-like ring-hydroxylating dioxygenase large terminal subunit
MERTLGREFYFSEEIFAREKERTFCREWFCVGRKRSCRPGATTWRFRWRAKASSWCGPGRAPSRPRHPGVTPGTRT